MTYNKILISSSSNKFSLIENVAVAIKKTQLNLKIILGDSNSKVISRYFGYQFKKMPKTLDINLREIINFCIANNIVIIIPTRSQELQFWSKNKKIFKSNNINIVVSKHKYVDICNDKMKFFNYGNKFNLPFIKSYLNINDISNCKKFVVKDRYGSGSNQILIGGNKKECLTFSKNLKYPIFQKYISGNEISADIYFTNKNEVKGMVLRERSLIYNGESKISKTFSNPNIEKKLLKTLKKFKFFGPINLQFFIDSNKRINIIEINPRFGGTSALSIKKGLDSFYWAIIESFKLNISIDYKEIKKDFILYKVSKLKVISSLTKI